MRSPEDRSLDLSRFATTAILAALDEQGVTQRELARRMGVSEPRISHILNGEANLTLLTICRMSSALDLNVGLVIGERPHLTTA